MSIMKLIGGEEFAADIDANFGPALAVEQKANDADLANDLLRAIKAKGMSQGSSAAGAISRGAVTSDLISNGISMELDSFKVPFAFGAEFGSKQYKRFRPYTPGNFLAGGYFFSPTIREFEGLRIEEYATAYSAAAAALQRLAIYEDVARKAAGVKRSYTKSDKWRAEVARRKAEKIGWFRNS